MIANVKDSIFLPLNWEDLGRVPAAAPVIPELLNQGESGALIGSAGVGKSLLGLDIGVALARGEPVLGRSEADPVTVMYIDMENPQAELLERLRCLGHNPIDMTGHPLLYFSFPDLPPLDTMLGGRVLAQEVARYDPQLIVFDSISRFIGGKEDAADTWQDFYTHTMIPLRRQNRTVLRLDHQGHDTGKGARGSSAKRDDVDVAWIMKRRGDCIDLKLDKGRGLGHPERVELRRKSNPLRHVLASPDSKLDECVDSMNALGIRLQATRDEAADMLRENGYKFSNTVIGLALKARRPSPTSGTEFIEDD